MKNIVIIPARSGSKRIKGKNTVKFFGSSIIELTLKKIFGFKIFDEIYISTNSTKIKKIAKKYKNVKIINRDKGLAQDKVPIYPVIKNAVLKIQNELKDDFLVYVILPTSIFIEKHKILKARKSIFKSKFLRSVSVSKFRKSFNKSFFLKNKKLIFTNQKSFFKNIHENKNFFYENGQCNIYHKDYFIDKRYKSKTKILPSVYSDLSSIDIDTNDDLKIAKKIFTSLNQN